MASFNKIYCFVEDLAEKRHNLSTDVLKVMFSTGVPLQTYLTTGNITEIAAGNGYATGGSGITITSSVQATGLYKLVGNDFVVTATGNSIGPLRYAVLYNSTAVSGLLIGYWDYGSNITLNSGESLTVDLDQSNGILTIQ